MEPFSSDDQTSTFILREGQVAQVREKPLSPLFDDSASGKVIDSKYEIRALIGEGGMGCVYRAHHILLKRDVALKTLRSSNLSGDFWERFQREVKSIANLNNPNVIKILDFGVSENSFPYYTMELLHGLSLADYLKQNGSLSTQEAVWIFSRICSAMSAVHALGVVHRDLKPANIFLVFESERLAGVKVLDFGIAKLNNDATLSSQKLTATGIILGSPLYMSPEQARGLDLDQRTDIYSFGCILFEALAGKPPFKGSSALQTMHLHQVGEVPPLSRSKPDERVDPQFEHLLHKLLAKKAQARLQTFDEISAFFSQIDRDSKAVRLAGISAKSEPPAVPEPQSGKFRAVPLALIAASLAVLMSVVGYALLSRTPEQKAASVSQATVDKPDNPEQKSSRDFLAGFANVADSRPATSSSSGKTALVTPRKIQKTDFDKIAKIAPTDLKLDYASFDNSELAKLSKLKLRYLNFNFSNFNDLGARSLGHQISVRNLRLQATFITDEALKEISQIKTIEFLDLRNTVITDRGLEELAKMSSLATLRIAETKVTAGGIKKLCQLNNSITDVELTTGKLIAESELKELTRAFPHVSFSDKSDLDEALSRF
jgi:serine/threonine protein kinase